MFGIILCEVLSTFFGAFLSGKTYTMMGDKYEPGIIPLAVDYMFKEIENRTGREYLLRYPSLISLF